MKKYILLAVVLAGYLINSCSKDSSSIDDTSNVTARPLDSAEKLLVESDKKFGLKLFKKIIEAQPDSNVFISPLSVSMALGMTLNGAAGQTYLDMLSTLELNGLSELEIRESFLSLIKLLTNLDDKVLFEIANSIWYRNTFAVLDTFKDVNSYYFNAEINALDFNDPASVDIINDWVSSKTHQRIKEIIDNIEPSVIMFLINAIYFKGTWTYEFDEDNTTDDVFMAPAGDVPCKMMKISGDFDYYEDDDVQVVDLPYGDGKFSMTLFLPKQGTAVNQFTADLDESRWENYLAALQSDSGTVELPKFRLEYKLVMNDVLKALGMGIAFGGGADFTRINPSAALYISRVIHKTFVQVDEEGTEAAAVTLVEIRELSAGPSLNYHIRLDRPFLYVIRENHSNTILFMGKLMQPEWSE